jgi:hypothetical protein
VVVVCHDVVDGFAIPKVRREHAGEAIVEHHNVKELLIEAKCIWQLTKGCCWEPQNSPIPNVIRVALFEL